MPDPREGEAQLIALSGSLAELVEGLDMPDIISIFGESADAPKTVAVIAAEARRASSAVDKLLVGVRIAPTALKRLGPSSSAVEIFASEFAIVGQLTDARSVVDEAITELLSALSNASPLFNLPRHADEPHS